MKIIVKFFPEITIKSKSVRWYFIKILNSNICRVLKFYDCTAVVKYYWDYIEIVVNEEYSIMNIVEILICIPGIHHVLLVQEYCFRYVDDIFKKVMSLYSDTLVGKSFCVRVKRCGHHNFSSQELECYLGAMLCKNIKSSFVKLVDPEEVISLEVKLDRFLLLKNRYVGLGGFPIGSQGAVLSLISGGFDSGIASYMLVRRGCKVHYCFFNIGGDCYENRVHEIAYFLWKRFGCSHVVKFISIDFSCVIDEILNKINSSYMGVVLKRMMIRAATLVAKGLNISALVTGEVLGQVSSQTLINLNIINSVTDVMIFRPLISFSKEDIIDISRKIDIEKLIINVPEYCALFSKKPNVKASNRLVEFEEKKFNFSILTTVVNRRKIVNITNFFSKNNLKIVDDIKFVDQVDSSYIVIDIRLKVDQKRRPLCLGVIEVQNIPFYKLFNVFFTLDQDREYLLYCEKAIMSRSQALYLRSHGFNNVHVYLPSKDS
ncbi:tRNA uracil 4-sulfurtransferase ThiI [Blochmannia endosymbiont of Polyrhachis (Hedomyrma) turneri]|uniref:tRNA uracil 4-sulfurtransferase ThiI n=1 Tax=Blochmannia endosymbiont of Polyrhachis (Hedomyrma) turneri TaxID=1505596 RepID=UPI00061A7D04|nr:tRNA uracil 4-sulfurtransferase ThiI [Blochmannia endosymbiont of Polyrhachis (Hedomyrma) turneri]AKC59809.1 tRNA sulfurtransferase [Blochmannia endosymbiont of Polyrhachis (Hedomyrma) turneri]